MSQRKTGTPTQAGRPEPQLEEALDRIVTEGQERLERPLLALLATGVLGGIDIAIGIFAFLLVKAQTDNTLLAGLAFSVGFVALLLARSELFTENFLVPVTAVAAKSGTLLELLRLWAVTLLANLGGGLFMMWVLVVARPDLHSTAVKTGEHYADLGVTAQSFALAVLAGVVITLMTRMQLSTESVGVQLVPAILFGALLAGGELFHCILDSLYIFAAMLAGADITVGAWLVALSWSALGNLVGGVGLVTTIRMVRVRRRLAELRQE